MLHSAASDMGQHCLPITLLQVSRQQWVNITSTLVDHFVSSPTEKGEKEQKNKKWEDEWKKRKTVQKQKNY